MSTPADRWSVTLEGETLLGRYVVERMIGGGGMANVYLARDEQLEIPVVVKVPHAAFLAERGFRERFERETRDLVALQHPHIVRILARGEHEGLPFLVMPFLDGGSFGDRMRRQKGAPMAYAAIEPWFRDVARALDFIHAKGIVHRDIKPDNVLFDEHGHGYLSDFGIAKAVGGADTGLTVTGATPGSPAYMAPEQPRTSALTGSSDQYSLAATVYEALSGRPVFEGETVVDVLIKKQSEEPAHLADLLPDLPRPVADAIMRGLARQPEDRFETCAAMADAMAAAPEAAPEAVPVPVPMAQVPATPPAAATAPSVPAPLPPRAAAAPAPTVSAGTTVTLGGGTKAMWIVFAVLLLGGPAAVLLLGRGGEGGGEPPDATVAKGPLPPTDEDSGIPPAMGGEADAVKMRAGPGADAWRVEKAADLVGTWVLDVAAARSRLAELPGSPNAARLSARRREELVRMLASGAELTLRADGGFRLTFAAHDRRAAEGMTGRWSFAGGRVRFTRERPSKVIGKGRIRMTQDSFEGVPTRSGLALTLRGSALVFKRK